MKSSREGVKIKHRPKYSVLRHSNIRDLGVEEEM